MLPCGELDLIGFVKPIASISPLAASADPVMVQKQLVPFVAGYMYAYAKRFV
jgi:hypothetical protein